MGFYEENVTIRYCSSFWETWADRGHYVVFRIWGLDYGCRYRFVPSARIRYYSGYK